MYHLDMNEETIKLLEKRRSLRSFSDAPIEKEVLDKMKRLTLRAPSAGNMNMFSIVEVTDPAIKKNSQSSATTSS